MNKNTPICSCPSGNGSLQWPCAAHQPELTAEMLVLSDFMQYLFRSAWAPDSLEARSLIHKYLLTKASLYHSLDNETAANNAFAEAFVGYNYGEEETQDARGWFVEGYKAAKTN